MPESIDLLVRVLNALHRTDEANAVMSDARAKGIVKP